MRLMAICRSLIKVNFLRTAWQRFAFLLVVGTLIGMAFLAIWLRVSKFEPVNQFNALKVGGHIPHFSGISMTGMDLGTGRPPGKFHIYVIDERLPPLCLDLECGEQAEAVINRGGHLIGGSDFKFAKLFGVKVIKTRSLMRQLMYHLPSNVERLARNLGLKVRRDFWSLETSLIVVADCDRRIIGIFKNAGIKDVPHILRHFEDTELCSH